MTTSRYELLYIIPTTFTDEEAGTVEQKVAALITKAGGTTESTRRLGKFRLAYPVKKQRHGYYVLVMLTCEHGSVAKLDELLRITPEVLRHLIVRGEEGGEAKFDLVQFNEIVVEGGRGDRDRRREKGETKDEVKAEIKEGVAALEKKEGETEVKDEAKISDADLDSKIASALSEDVKAV